MRAPALHAGHQSYAPPLHRAHWLARRALYQANGQFMAYNLNDWQHSAMCECPGEAGLYSMCCTACDKMLLVRVVP